MPDQPIRLLVVDDHDVVREGLCHAFESSGVGVVVGEADSLECAHDLLGGIDVDVAIVDIVLPDGDGIGLCREIRSRHPETACVLLSSYRDEESILAAIVAGAVAYLPKDTSASKIVATVKDVASGRSLIDEDGAATLIAQMRSPDGDGRVQGLANQEQRTFELIGQGLTNHHIANRMHLAESTVRNYVSQILSKFDMERRTQAAALAARLAERQSPHHPPTKGTVDS